jgi:hypothetical protein
LINGFVYFPKWKFTKPKKKKQKKSKTSNVLAIINATVNGAESATGYDALDDEPGGVNLPSCLVTVGVASSSCSSP